MIKCPNCKNGKLKQHPTHLNYFRCGTCKKTFKLRYWSEDNELIFKIYDVNIE